MNLRNRPLLYVFLETGAIAEQRQFLEKVVGLPVVETDPDPRHRHGVVKYDAGAVLVGLNLAPARRFPTTTSDAMTMVFDPGGALRTDGHGHHFVVGEASGPLTEIRLRVPDLAAAVAFYRDVLGLAPIETPRGTAIHTPTVRIILESSAVAADGKAVRHDTYTLVFHTDDVRATCATLAGNGLNLIGRAVTNTEIGHTARFTDVGGHHFCLYKPSPKALGWPSGATIRQILTGRLPR